MSRFLPFLIIFFYSHASNVCFSQEESSGIDYLNELQKMIAVPHSPEAEASMRYGKPEVNLYTGQPDIGIPIYTHKGRELDLPMALTYNASGITVDQMASQVGLGWNLNSGGRITRVVNGAPDDFINALAEYSTIHDPDVRANIIKYVQNSQSFNTSQEVEDYLYFMKHLSSGHTDAQPDYFSLNVPGINDHIVYDLETMELHTLNNPRIKVQALFDATDRYISEWTITNEDGTRFYFTKREKTYYSGNDYTSPSTSPELYGLVKEYYSSWVLTRIISANSQDIYEFSYVDFGYWAQPQPVAPVINITNEVNDRNASANNYPIDFGEVYKFSPEFKIQQQFLSHIYHNNRLIISIDLKSRLDVDQNNAIDAVNIHDPGNEATVLKKFNFNHSYFGQVNSDPSSQDPSAVRLKLDEIQIQSNSITYQKYSFNYTSPEQVPSRALLSRDYLGYFNGANNYTLYPAATVGNDTYEGAFLQPNLQKAEIGTLKKIYYPTGGFTEFEYELHQVPTSELSSEDYVAKNVTYHNTSVIGGEGDGTGCGAWCIDKFGNPPVMEHHVFELENANHYTLTFDNLGISEVYLIYRGPNTSPKAPAPLSYDQIIDQSSGAPLVDFEWFRASSNSGDLTEMVKLGNGYYQITLINGTSEGHTSFKLTGEELELISSTPTGNNQYKAGLRVKKISDYESEDKLAAVTEYKYTQSLTSDVSSGKVIFDPVLKYYSNRLIFIQPGTPDLTNYGYNSGLNIVPFMHRVVSSYGGDRPHVAYERVYEIDKDLAGNATQPNGYTLYEFYTGTTGLYSTGVPPNANSYLINSEVGRTKSITVSNNMDEVLTQEQHFFFDASYFGTQGLYTHINEEFTYSYPLIYSLDGKYYWRPVNAEWRGLVVSSSLSGIMGSGQLFPHLPPDCDEPGSYCIESLQFAVNEPRITVAQGVVPTQIQKYKKTYDLNGNHFEENTTQNYDPQIDYLLRTNTSEDINGEVLTVKYHYPKDFQGNSTYDEIIQNNHLNQIVMQKQILGNQILFTRKTNYKKIGQGFYPSLIEGAKANNPLEPRIKYDYDAGGAIIESWQLGSSDLSNSESHTRTAYIWGYNNQYLVAKVENATHDDITAVLGSATLATIKDPNFSLTEQQLRDLLLPLQASLPEALVYIYTYKSGIGLGSITDPNGLTTTYEYDDFQRVRLIRNHNGEVVKKYDYRYKSSDQ